MTSEASPIRRPREEPPPFGEPVGIAPGIRWLRLPLPYALDHVNVYLIEDEGGWTLFDTGISDEPGTQAWERVLGHDLGGRPITRLVVSHFHPDHVGMAGWLNQRFAAPLHMPQTEYLLSRLLQVQPASSRSEEPLFYKALGVSAEELERILNRGKSYLQRVTGVPPSYSRIAHGDTIRFGGRDWRALTGGGHAPEQAMLWCEADRLFFSADQVLARISPNVSVNEIEPGADPLRLYLESLDEIRRTVPDDVLVLPGHDLPFYGLHERIEQLTRHHEHRCDQIEAACRERAATCRELLPVLFRRPLDPHTMSFALGEALAHLNYMVAQGRLVTEPDGEARRYRAA